jgi:hypothetical protein
MNGGRKCVLAVLLLAAAGGAMAQFGKIERARGFKLPRYYPATNGVQRLQALLTSSEAQMLTNGFFYLVNPRIESYREDGVLEWVAQSIDAVVSMNTQAVAGTNDVMFRTATTNLFVTGRGFLWQHTNSVLILSNQTRTWIDKAAVTDNSIPQ